MSNRLLELRASTGKSRAEVAAELSVSERHLYRLETGKTPVSRRWAFAFAAYYGVRVEDIEEARP